MNPVDNERSTALEVVACGRRHGVDLDPWRKDSVFQKGLRFIFLWRKVDALPCTGPADAPEGTLYYNLQGDVRKPPAVTRTSSRFFRGVWSEAGTLDSIDAAFDLVKSWMVDRSEVDDLPARRPRRRNW